MIESIDGDYRVRVHPHGAVERILNTAPPVPEEEWNELQLRRRFTAAERLAIKAAAKTDPQVDDFIDLVASAGRTGTRLKASDADFRAGMLHLVQSGLLTVARAKAIANIE